MPGSPPAAAPGPQHTHPGGWPCSPAARSDETGPVLRRPGLEEGQALRTVPEGGADGALQATAHPSMPG